MGHYFEKEITKFLAEETDEDKRMLKTGFCDWFWKWELVDTGVSDLKKQVNILKHLWIYYSMLSYSTLKMCKFRLSGLPMKNSLFYSRLNPGLSMLTMRWRQNLMRENQFWREDIQS